MALEINLYRSADYVQSYSVQVVPLLRTIFEPLLGEALRGARFRLIFLPVADSTVLDGSPVMVNLNSGHDWVQVYIISDDGFILYQHPHSVMEIIARPLQRALSRREPGEEHWGFGIAGLGGEHTALVRPQPEGVMTINMRRSDPRKPIFRVEQVPAPEPPQASLAALGVTEQGSEGTDAVVGVVLAADAHERLAVTMELSAEVEAGGFLVGRVYANADQPGAYLVLVTAVLEAERTGASLLHFTFAGESFTKISEEIATREQGEELVGWYHTHLFPATDELGLSSIDVALHADTFRQPWQVAGLINLAAGQRVVRFYASDASGMTQVPSWVAAS